MAAVLLHFVLIIYLCTSGKSQSCDKSTLERPDNVDLSSLNPSYNDGESVRLTCEPGYTGILWANCKKGGWTTTKRPCQKKSCGHPGDTPNGDFELVDGDDFVFGAVVQYTCKTGYHMMSRNTQRSCVANGWDNDVPVCEEVKCPVIRVPENVQASGNLEDGAYGDVINFECQSQDMQLSAPGEIHCTDEGKWSGEIPTCRAIQCEKPDIPHGRIISNQRVFKKGESLRYTCDEGYRASDRPNPSCTKFGWTSPPECKEITCSLDIAPTGTTRLPESQNIFRRGEKVEIVCEDGYRTSTNKQRDTFLCEEDGKWQTGEIPNCKEIFCRRPNQHHVRFPWSYKYSYKYKDTVNYDCDENYKKTQRFATCGIEGWTPKTLCVHRDLCLSPTIENGYIVKPEKDKVVFACNRNFKLNSGGWFKESRCIKGSWSPFPKCIGKFQCISRPVVEYVRYSEDEREIYNNGDSQRFDCEPGYTSESKIIHCKGGEWEKPQCKRDSNWCTAPPNVENAIIVTSYERIYRDKFKVTYQCHQSYTFVGKDTITCNFGKWSSPPKCILIRCEKPDIPHGEVIRNSPVFRKDDILRYTCEEGYKASDEPEPKCTSNGWSSTPECKTDHELCTAPPNLNNGRIVSNNGSNVKYECDEFYDIDGKHTITCISGKWTNSPTCKKSCKVTEEDMNKRNINFTYPDNVQSYVKHNDHLTFVCKNGKTERNSVQMRQQCKDGIIRLPECE